MRMFLLDPVETSASLPFLLSFTDSSAIKPAINRYCNFMKILIISLHVATLASLHTVGSRRSVDVKGTMTLDDITEPTYSSFKCPHTALSQLVTVSPVALYL